MILYVWLFPVHSVSLWCVFQMEMCAYEVSDDFGDGTLADTSIWDRPSPSVTPLSVTSSLRGNGGALSTAMISYGGIQRHSGMTMQRLKA